MMFGFSVERPAAFLWFFHRLFMARTASMMASEEPMQEVPMAPAALPSSVGALNKRPIMDTQRFYRRREKESTC